MTNFAVTKAQSHFCAVCKTCRVKHVPVDWGMGGGGGSHTVIENKLNGRNWREAEQFCVDQLSPREMKRFQLASFDWRLAKWFCPTRLTTGDNSREQEICFL